MNEMHRNSPADIEKDIGSIRSHIDETLDNIERRLSLRRLAAEVLDVARASSSAFASNAATMAGNAGRAVRDNPLPVAFLCLGAAWLIMSNRRPDSADASGDAADRRSARERNIDRGRLQTGGYPGAGEAARRESRGAAQARGQSAVRPGAGTDAGRSWNQAYANSPSDDDAENGHANANRVSPSSGRMDEGADHDDGRARRAGEGIAGRASEAADAVAARASAAGEAIADRASSAAGSMANSARRVGEGAGRAARATGDYAREHPIMTGAALLLAGAAIAALLPRTRAEDDWMGESSARVKRAAKQAAGEVVDTAGEAATAAAEEFQAEAERRDLTPERAKRETAELAEGGRAAARSAILAARDRIVEERDKRTAPQGGDGGQVQASEQASDHSGNV